MTTIANLICEMAKYDEGRKELINHFMKVYGYAKTIGEMENLSPEQQNILEIAAVTHDCGIKKAMEEFGSAEGRLQQITGPMVAHEMLERMNYSAGVIDRVCYLIAHHHTYDDIDGLDYRILVEADFLVNIDENGMHRDTIPQLKNRIFRTKGGLALLKALYGV